MDEFETRTLEASELRVESRGMSPVIRGYAIVFKRLSEDLGGFREQIDPAAIDRTLSEGVDLRALVNHDANRVLGRLSAGTLRIEKDGNGLRVEVDPPAEEIGIVNLIRRRDVTGMSFAFRTMPNGDDWNFKTDPPTRTVTDMRVREVSVVTFPAYSQTDVAMRSMRQAAYVIGRQEGFLEKPRPLTVSERIAWASARKIR